MPDEKVRKIKFDIDLMVFWNLALSPDRLQVRADLYDKLQDEKPEELSYLKIKDATIGLKGDMPLFVDLENYQDKFKIKVGKDDNVAVITKLLEYLNFTNKT